MVVTLASGYFLRSPTQENIPSIFNLITTWTLAETPSREIVIITTEEISHWFHTSDLERDMWLVNSLEGDAVGYGIIWDLGFGRYYTLLLTHPAHTGQGISTTLLRLAEARVHEMISCHPINARIALQARTGASNKQAHRLMEQEGYKLSRFFWHMGIELAAMPAAPEWPKNTVLCPFMHGRDEHVTYTIVQEGLRDARDFVPRSFEEWLVLMTDRGNYDPSLWFLALGGNEPIGVILCEVNVDGWVYELSVRRPWRRRGLGRALLQHAFAEFYSRGYRKVKLSVDAQSLTGAQRLYEQAGMFPLTQFSLYEKLLRTGVDLAAIH